MSEQPIWRPSPERVERANLTRFTAFLHQRGSFPVAPQGAGATLLGDYGTLHEWSVLHPVEFWRAVAEFCGVEARGPVGSSPWDAPCIGLERMAPPDPVLGPRWFVGTTLNFAENLLRYRDDRAAIVAWNELGRRSALSFRELYVEVARVASALRQVGVVAGDRIAAFLPNVPEAIVAMLATASIGAVWSSCSPDFGVQGVLDRFGQIRPRVLFCADGYRYAGKANDSLERVREIAERIPEIERVVVLPYLRVAPDVSAIPSASLWHDFANPVATEVVFEQMPFDHPLYIMYSSGTTGLPKCMVHGAGGTLLQHAKELVLHTDVTREDRLFYFTTCGWMMWNWMVSALAAGSTLILYDGAPLAPDATILWDMAEAERLTVFGTSARYLALLEKAGARPRESHKLSSLRAILSTGSPLAAASYDYVYRDVKEDVHLASISGGTDIISCFALGNPTAPVHRGEIQCRGLGMAVTVFGEAGSALLDAPGELVCTRPFPSMPVTFWNDPDRARYSAAYFEHFPGVWRHGDWARLTRDGGVIILGRSDATLNPGGVRIGTAEIYRQVEQLPEVMESVAVGQETREGTGEGVQGDVRVVLFVRLREGAVLDDALAARIRRQIRENTTPMHVPRAIVQVADIPRTISGKISEMAVRDVIHGRPVANTEALANPESLELYQRLEALIAV